MIHLKYGYIEFINCLNNGSRKLIEPRKVQALVWKIVGKEHC